MDKILLFDIDGTLVESSENIKPEMSSILNSLKEKGYSLGVVGGGKLDKILQQNKLKNKIIYKNINIFINNISYYKFI